VTERALCTVVLATTNRGKLEELRSLLEGLPLRLIGLSDLMPKLPPIVEDGASFEANAEKKAREVCRACGLVTLADDSGLEVDALGGRPGVRSARFAGDAATDTENNQRLLSELRGQPASARSARFRCVVALQSPWAKLPRFGVGVCEGRIAAEGRGDHGFGYDPLFLTTERPGFTLAEIGPEEKNQISHRARAVQALRPEIEATLRAMLGDVARWIRRRD
jgi:XTP/dITP diphosphohydrolase